MVRHKDEKVNAITTAGNKTAGNLVKKKKKKKLVNVQNDVNSKHDTYNDP